MTSRASVTLEVVEEKHFEDIARVKGDFLNSKHCCCFLPLGIGALSEVRANYRKNPELMQVAAVAIVPDKGVVGFVQMIFHGMPCDIHKAKEGEAYIFVLAVVEEARGMGVGTALMRWAEDLAKQRDSKFMSLEVIHGNPAISLYERKGYVVKPSSILATLCIAPLICCWLGPLICPSGSPSYCSYGRIHYMEKPL